MMSALQMINRLKGGCGSGEEAGRVACRSADRLTVTGGSGEVGWGFTPPGSGELWPSSLERV